VTYVQTQAFLALFVLLGPVITFAGVMLLGGAWEAYRARQARNRIDRMYGAPLSRRDCKRFQFTRDL